MFVSIYIYVRPETRVKLDKKSHTYLLLSINLYIWFQCEIDGEVEYEFPIYNQTETLPGLWDAGDPRYRTTGACYGGLRLFTPPSTPHMFTSVFPHIQVSCGKLEDCFILKQTLTLFAVSTIQFEDNWLSVSQLVIKVVLVLKPAV